MWGGEELGKAGGREGPYRIGRERATDSGHSVCRPPCRLSTLDSSLASSCPLHEGLTAPVHNLPLLLILLMWSCLPAGTRRPTGWAYKFTATNTTVIFRWTSCLCEVTPAEQLAANATKGAMHLDRPEEFLREHFRTLDVIIMNTGHHWNRWVWGRLASAGPPPSSRCGAVTLRP